jgi:ribosomal small subunit protein bTHX
MTLRQTAYYTGRVHPDRYGEESMGKGDKRTFRGKVFKGSHGNTRPRKTKKKAPAKKS